MKLTVVGVDHAAYVRVSLWLTFEAHDRIDRLLFSRRIWPTGYVSSSSDVVRG